MHIELSPKFAPGLTNIINHLHLEAHLINSFNASGETITLSASKEDLDKILQATDQDFQPNPGSNHDETGSIVTLEELKAILIDQLTDGG
jgi:hypothetical protein